VRIFFFHGEVHTTMKGGGSDTAKKRAGESAAREVTDGMVVGLGTGSTAAHAIRTLGERVDSGLDISAIPTSFQSRKLARDEGIPLRTLDEATPDVAIDGADQVANGHLVKGGGAAHAREKLVDAAAERFIVVVDPTKITETLDYPVPVEVLPDARTAVASTIESLGGDPTLRSAERKDGPVVTDNGNLVLDCAFGPIEDAKSMGKSLSTIPGVVEHGLFLDLADEIHVGKEDDVDVRQV
jgi:ribose 5-phosphate isomerase A